MRAEQVVIGRELLALLPGVTRGVSKNVCGDLWLKAVLGKAEAGRW